MGGRRGTRSRGCPSRGPCSSSKMSSRGGRLFHSGGSRGVSGTRHRPPSGGRHRGAGLRKLQTSSCSLRNAEANAEYKGLDVDHLVVDHIQVNRAPKMRRRTYRAHGRINPYMCSPSHVEIILTQRDDISHKVLNEEPERKKKVSQKKLKRQKMMQRE